MALGLETATLYEVTAGLKDGDLVVVGDTTQLEPGQKVQPLMQEPVARQ